MNIRELLNVMIKQDSSDIYITVDSPPMFRTEGITRPYGNQKITSAQAEEIALSIMTEKQKIKFAARLEMNLALYYPELGRFRVNIFRQKGYTAIVIRQIKMEFSTIDKAPLLRRRLGMRKRLERAPAAGISTTPAGAIPNFVYAASLSTADVQAAIDPASDGDTVVLPAGSSTAWTSGVTCDKAITIKGAGGGWIQGSCRDSKTLTDSGTVSFNVRAGTARHGFTVGDSITVQCKHTANAWMSATVDSWDGSVLGVTITGQGAGTGTEASWTFTKAGDTIINFSLTTGEVLFALTESTAGYMRVQDFDFRNAGSSGWVFEISGSTGSKPVIWKNSWAGGNAVHDHGAPP